MLGLINLVISPSLSQFMEDVRDGKLDYTLVKPRDAQLLVSVSQFHVFKLIDVGLGIAVVVYAALRLGTSVGTGAAMSLLATLVLGSAIVYGFWMALATLAFWFIRIENLLWIFWMVYGAGRWPVDIYPGWMRWALTLIVPIAFAVTVPAEALTGRLQPGNFALATALAVAAVAGSRAFWKLGLRHYSGASA
jgi:ABC-2 type transport system permease protein